MDKEAAVLTSMALNSPFAEAYRSLRASIDLSAVKHPLRSILVTSAARGEGKTTTVANLGIVMAQAGARVILADADFRHPGLLHLVGGWSDGAVARRGLSDVLAGSAQLDDVIRQVAGYRHLLVLGAGNVSPTAFELLSSDRASTIVKQLATRADIVLIDTPPAVPYSDAIVLARSVDGVLCVLRAGPQDMAMQRRLLGQLEQASARVLGVVLNQVDPEDAIDGQYDAGRASRRRV